MKLLRYPGAQPFQTQQKHIFFGRKKELDHLLQLIDLESLVVLYSKSGIGKSSLINAGLIPRYTATRQGPVVLIRFGAYSQENSKEPALKTLEYLNPGQVLHDTIERLVVEDQSFWAQIKSRQLIKNEQQFFLIFDQFEELFTYPAAAIINFKKQLADLLYSSLPERYRDNLEQQREAFSEKEWSQLHRPFQVKIMLAIRADRISLLERISDYLPVKKVWYEIKPLNLTQAEDAILLPAFTKGSFESSVFDYSDEAIEKILNYLTKDGEEEVESFQLQIVCQSIERKVIEKNLKTVSVADVGNLEYIFEHFYDDQIALLESEEDQLAARQLIEEGMIFEEEKRRLSVYEGQVYQSFGVSPELLRQLVDTRLVRAEPNPKGGFTYELSHDTLVEPVLKAKKNRMESEQRIAEAKALLEKEKELEKERKKRRRNLQLAAFGFLLAAISLVASGFAFFQYAAAEKERSKAIEAFEQAEAARGEAVNQRSNAVKASQEAELAQKKAEEERNKAVESDKYAQLAKTKAESAEKVAREALNEAALTQNVMQASVEDHTLGFNLAYVYYKTKPGALGAKVLNSILDDPELSFYQKPIPDSEEVLHARYSPDGKFILIGNTNNSAVLYNVDSKTKEQEFKDHSGSVVAVGFSPDGKRIITGSKDGTVRVWDIPSGEYDEIWADFGMPTMAVECSPDGAYYLIKDAYGRILFLPVSEDAPKKRTLRDVSAFCFTADKNFLVTASFPTNYGKTYVRRYFLAQQDSIKIDTFSFAEPITSIDFSKDGKYGLLAYADGTVSIWDAQLKIRLSSRSYTPPPTSAGFSADGRSILMVQEQTVKALDIFPGVSQEESIPGSGSVNGMASFSKNQKYIINHNHDTVWVSDGLSGELLVLIDIKNREKAQNRIRSAVFSPDSKYIAVATHEKRKVLLYDAMSGNEIRAFDSNDGHRSAVICADFSPDGKKLVTSSDDRTVKLWEVATGKLLHSFKGHRSGVRMATFSPNGKYIASGSNYDGRIILWDIEKKMAVREIIGHDGNSSVDVMSVRFSPDGNYLISASLDNTAKVWSIPSLDLVHTLKGHKNYVSYADFSPDGAFYISSSWDKSIKIWEAHSGNLIYTHLGSIPFNSAFFSPDGRYILGAAKGEMIFWEDPFWKLQNGLIYKLGAEEKARYNIRLDY